MSRAIHISNLYLLYSIFPISIIAAIVFLNLQSKFDIYRWSLGAKGVNLRLIMVILRPLARSCFESFNHQNALIDDVQNNFFRSFIMQ